MLASCHVPSLISSAICKLPANTAQIQATNANCVSTMAKEALALAQQMAESQSPRGGAGRFLCPTCGAHMGPPVVRHATRTKALSNIRVRPPAAALRGGTPCPSAYSQNSDYYWVRSESPRRQPLEQRCDSQSHRGA